MIKIFVGVISLLLMSCASGPVGDPKGFHLRPYQEMKLDNGLRLLLVKDTSLPRVGLALMVNVGSLQDPAGQEGINSFTTAMLEQGTTSRGAMKLADSFGDLGTELSHSTNSDYTMISTSGLSQDKETLLDLFADVVTNPAFSMAEVERKRSEYIAALTRSSDQPTSYADELFYRVLYGDHPYGTKPIGKIKSIQGLRRADLMRHYFRYYRPNNAIFAVTGNFDEAFVEHVKKVFSAWPSKELEMAATKPLPEEKSAPVKLFTKPDLQQTQIRLGQLGIKRSDEDFLPLRLASMVLGGSFSSRLNQRVRDDLGLTYSISSSSEARLERGPFEISTFTRNDKVGETIRETQKVVKDFVEKGVSEAELKAAQTLLVGQFPTAIETTDRFAYNLMVLRRYGISDDYLQNFRKNVESITVKRVNAAIAKHFHLGNLRVVVFGDDKKVLGQLKELGPVDVEKAVVE